MSKQIVVCTRLLISDDDDVTALKEPSTSPPKFITGADDLPSILSVFQIIRIVSGQVEWLK